MSAESIAALRLGAAALSIVLMGTAGMQLIWRFVLLLRGRDPMPEGEIKPLDVRGMGAAALAALVSRLAVYLLAFALFVLVGEEGGLLETLKPLWLRWDARHYIGIAESGYAAVGDDRLRLVFFPLYPALMRMFSVLTGGDAFYGGLLVSLLCSMGAAAFVYDLGTMHGGKRIGVLSIAYFLLSPMSVFLNCAYTEALFLCLTLGTVCLLRRGHPWIAALCGAASALTRMPGVIVSGLFIIAFLGKCPKRQCGAKAALACMTQVLIVFTGLFLYWGINYAVTGDAFTYLIYQRENWYQEAGSFWETAATTMQYVLMLIGEDDWFFCWVTQLIAMFAVYALLVFKGKILPFDLAAYSFVYIAVVLSPTWLLSGPRYLYALCALPLLKAKMVKSDVMHGVLLGSSAVLLAVYTYGYTLVQTVL